MPPEVSVEYGKGRLGERRGSSAAGGERIGHEEGAGRSKGDTGRAGLIRGAGGLRPLRNSRATDGRIAGVIAQGVE